MIKFEKFQLANGLKVIVHRDAFTPIVAINILYNVGARDEHPEHTGFAHLFEHLMFGGSANIPKYDEPLQKVGGENNAFTNSDITNYYLTLPVNNIETGFWLESDRMMKLAFSEKNLNIQKNVVIEEYKQCYLNQPYGDVWLLLCPLAYKVHPYRYPTIGKDISHIENATLNDVKEFFYRYYRPNNAILVVAGNVETEKIQTFVEKWFGSIEKGTVQQKIFPQEPEQTEERKLSVEREVPFNAIYKTFHVCARGDRNFYTVDLIAGILSDGRSSRLYQRLVKEKRLFSEISAFTTGTLDNGLFIIAGNLIDGVKMDKAENSILDEINLLKTELVSQEELNKLKNRIEAKIIFEETNVLNKAMNLAFYELLGDAELVNQEIEKYHKVNPEQIIEQANSIFRESNCSTLYYYAKR